MGHLLAQTAALLPHRCLTPDLLRAYILLLAGHGGLRAQELVTVRWGDLSLIEGKLHVLCWLVTSSALKSCGRSLGQNPGTQGFCAL